jgi:hypothetical protein
MYNPWSIKMKVGDLISFEDDFDNSMIKAGIGIGKVGIIVKVKDMFYRIRTGQVEDLWVSPPDIKRIRLDKR